MKVNKPVAVLISDIHFTVPTLELASLSLLRAMFKAKMLDVPLIIAGDTLDSKAIIRAECANKLMRLLCVKDKTETYILVGNHDLINEKSDDHALQFLHGFANVIDKPTEISLGDLDALLVPYQSNTEKIKSLILHQCYPDEDGFCPDCPPKTWIMHQGLLGAHMGHYVQDKTSLPPETFDGYRIISGHYHRSQTIKCGKTGSFSYIGNPYTLSFAEAHDGPKGYQILMEDGSLEQVVLDLRKHVILEYYVKELDLLVKEGKKLPNIRHDDLVWLKVHLPRSLFSWFQKKQVGDVLFGHSNYKLDLIAIDSDKIDNKTDTMTDDEILDALITALPDSKVNKASLMKLWREIV